MPYSDFMLRDGEELVLDLHPHWWYFASAFLAAVGAFILGAVVLVTVDSDATLAGPLHIGAALLILGTLVWLAERYIRWISTHFVLTTDRVIYRSGVVAKHGIEIPLQRINTIFFSQRIFERLLGLGDLKIESASETGAQVFEDIRSPDKVQHDIYAQMEANENRGLEKLGDRLESRQAPPAAAPAAASPSVTDQIAELHQLHQAGALTDAEFEAKKAELLARL
ncbi:MAG: PH domain-containing protein [Acidimicrobiales bacterium]